MFKICKAIWIFSGSFLVIPLFCIQAYAQGNIELTTVAEKEVQVLNAQGQRERKMVPVEKVLPGEEVIYTIYFTNVSDAPAENVIIVDPVPGNTAYKEGTAFGPGTVITFSVDGGSRFDRPENLTITGKDGRIYAARPSDYTHIRWAFEPALEPGKRGFVRFRAAVR